MFKMMMCKEATRLMSKRLDAPLSFQEKLSLKLHLAMCDACTECNKQFALLHEVGPRFEMLVSEIPDEGGSSRQE
ncbi:hypothetical protein L861_11250 [Litchfieldella anticariensis FP35 = DSM 16096]|uniref:Putative zinc-finger domain-containing protein n=2 Tax=Litchfieldella anticariensis TaxID=258591 RepID=S2KL33_LITA3|nr:zf-HC2 domain-containing protein [Halomonas anticariensis]EPC01143.1 hypothetical protein L861_11250 [Halomonas anticariensis FP35 = DSM 16096]